MFRYDEAERAMAPRLRTGTMRNERRPMVDMTLSDMTLIDMTLIDMTLA